MPCCLARPCGGQVALKLVLPDAILYECVNAHTLRVGAPPPLPGPRPPYVPPAKGTCAHCRKSASGKCVDHGAVTPEMERVLTRPKARGCNNCLRSGFGPCKVHGGLGYRARMMLYSKRRRTAAKK